MNKVEHDRTPPDESDEIELFETISDGPRLIRLNDAAARLGISRTTAWEMARSGRFPVPVIQVGSSRRVNLEHLAQFMRTGVPVRLEEADA